ncbi:hypothetical protein LY76DRAFT_592473 [Colletotrichum caudatum]|nr:hypothetical protein LY76DRAFT_592473 [Colletotrichum caudatum]
MLVVVADVRAAPVVSAALGSLTVLRSTRAGCPALSPLRHPVAHQCCNRVGRLTESEKREGGGEKGQRGTRRM